MTYPNDQLSAIKDIKQIMERSSRFISLSGWSGIAAGICGLTGAIAARIALTNSQSDVDVERTGDNHNIFGHLLVIAILTFITAFISAFIFTYIRSRKNNTPIWGTSARRLMINVSIPMIVGGVFLLKLLDIGAYQVIVPGCLLFYGLALLNGSKYTLGEIRYLGYCEIILGILSCWIVGWGLYFWAIGFGLMHIVYGAVMLSKYERKEANQ